MDNLLQILIRCVFIAQRCLYIYKLNTYFYIFSNFTLSKTLFSKLYGTEFQYGDTVVKNNPANAGDTGDTGYISESGRFPGEGNGNPLQYS